MKFKSLMMIAMSILSTGSVALAGQCHMTNNYGTLQGSCDLYERVRTCAGCTPSFQIVAQGQTGEYRVLHSGNLSYHGNPRYYDPYRNGDGVIQGSVQVLAHQWRSDYTTIYLVSQGHRFQLFSGYVDGGSGGYDPDPGYGFNANEVSQNSQTITMAAGRAGYMLRNSHDYYASLAARDMEETVRAAGILSQRVRGTYQASQTRYEFDRLNQAVRSAVYNARMVQHAPYDLQQLISQMEYSIERIASHYNSSWL